MRQSVSLQLFNFLYSKFTDLGVPVIRTKLNQELPYPFIAIQDIKDDINRLTFDSYGGSPTATIHIWCKDDDKGKNDELYMQVQSILLDEIQLDGYTLTTPSHECERKYRARYKPSVVTYNDNVEYASH